MKLLNSGVVNWYWPVTPTYQIWYIADPNLAHFVLNLRAVFKSSDLLERSTLPSKRLYNINYIRKSKTVHWYKEKQGFQKDGLMVIQTDFYMDLPMMKEHLGKRIEKD